MADIIKHQGIVENINGSHVMVRIVQTSACAACSAKGHCASADTKEKMIDVISNDASSYQPGDRVIVFGELSMGMMAVLLAFIIPFCVLIISLFYIYGYLERRTSLCDLFVSFPYTLLLYIMAE